jgi:hypothetical protein
MKIRATVTTLIFVFISAYSYSQFQLGVKGGLNLAEFDMENISTNTKTGYHFGAFTTFKFGKIGVQPEVIFSQQGTQFEFDGNDLESNFTYINVPVILKLYLVGGLNLQIGPQFGFLTSAESDFNPIDQTGSSDVREYYENSDLSLALGVGIDLPFNVNLDFRYNKGLRDINEPSLAMTRNQVFQVSAGIRIID